MKKILMIPLNAIQKQELFLLAGEEALFPLEIGLFTFRFESKSFRAELRRCWHSSIHSRASDCPPV